MTDLIDWLAEVGEKYGSLSADSPDDPWGSGAGGSGGGTTSSTGGSGITCSRHCAAGASTPGR